MRNLTQPEIEVTPFSPVAQKASQTGGAAPQADKTPQADDITTQRKLNNLEMRVCKLGGFKKETFLAILAIEAQLEDEDLAEGEITEVPRIAIAKCLPLKGNEESQKNAVTKLFQRIRKEQARCGRKLITITRGSIWADEISRPGIASHYRFVYRRTLQAFPHWKKSWQMTDQAARWIFENLPKAEPVVEREKLPPSLSDLRERALKAAEKLGNKIAQEIEEEHHSTPEAVRLIKDMAKVLVRVATSVEKTAPARRPSLNLPLHESQREVVAILEPPDVWEDDFETLEMVESSLFEEAISAPKEADFEPGLRVANLPRMFGDNKGLKPQHVMTCEAFDVPGNLTPIGGKFQPQPEAISELPDEEARRALEPFQSFPDAVLSLVTLLTLTDDSPLRKKVVGNHRNPSQAELKSDLGKWLEDAERLKASVFFRWTGSFIQVDDCNEEIREMLDPFSFFQVETSPGSFQSWLHLDFPPGYSLTEQAIHLESVRDRLLARLAEISKANWPHQKPPNGGSYGSVRWPGSRNFKPDRIRENNGTAPYVRMVAERPLFGVRADELDAADLLTPAPTPCATPPLPNSPSCDSTLEGGVTPGWEPHLSDEVERFNGDRNRADMNYAHISIKAGVPGHVVIKRIQENSEKSKERKDHYAVITVLKVIAYQELKAGHPREVVEARLLDVSRKAGSDNPELVKKALTRTLIKLGML